MGVNTRVFGSAAEQRAFHKLSRTWEKKYRIYHNLPFLNVFSLDGLLDYHGNLAPLEIGPTDYNRIKKTSIDFTLCDGDDKPILCIEFDGLRRGFNVGGTYTTKKGQIKPGWRRSITELKLRIAHGASFPYFVIGSSFFEDISNRTKLTVVDAIIGDVIASNHAHEVFSKGFNPDDVGYTQERFDALSDAQRYEIIQDWVLSVELESDMTHNPILTMNAKLDSELGGSMHKVEFLSYPEIPPDLAVPERIDAFNASLLNGARCTITDQKGRKYVGEAWVPNFKSPGCSGFGILMELAELFALDKAVRKRGKSIKLSESSVPSEL